MLLNFSGVVFLRAVSKFKKKEKKKENRCLLFTSQVSIYFTMEEQRLIKK